MCTGSVEAFILQTMSGSVNWEEIPQGVGPQAHAPPLFTFSLLDETQVEKGFQSSCVNLGEAVFSIHSLSRSPHPHIKGEMAACPSRTPHSAHHKRAQCLQHWWHTLQRMGMLRCVPALLLQDSVCEALQASGVIGALSCRSETIVDRFFFLYSTPD